MYEGVYDNEYSRTLTPMQFGRLSKILSKEYNIGKIMTLGDLYDSGLLENPVAVDVPSVQYNRGKWNRLDAQGQAEYQAKLDTTKKEYRLDVVGEDSYIIIPKMAYEYFSSFTF